MFFGILSILFSNGPVFSQESIITTVAGSGPIGSIQGLNFSGDGGLATDAKLHDPFDVAVAPDGSLIIADTNNHRIRKVDPEGIITTIAGGGMECHFGFFEGDFGGDGGAATSACLNAPSGVAIGSDGSIFIADEFNQRIRKVDLDGIITTVAGGIEPEVGVPLSLQDPRDGEPATIAFFNLTYDIAIAPDGSLFIAEGRRIRKVDRQGIITTVAGGGEPEDGNGDGGPATSARIKFPTGIALGPDGSLFIADERDFRIRKVDPHGIITTVAGTGDRTPGSDGGPATLTSIGPASGIAVGPDGSFYFSSAFALIRKVDPAGIISTVAGGGDPLTVLGDGGPATSARLDFPISLTLAADGSLFIADSRHHRIRKVTFAESRLGASSLAQASVTPRTVDFGAVPVGTTAEPASITISNPEMMGLIVTNLIPPRAPFSLQSQPPLPTTIAPRGSLTFTVNFTPSSAGCFSDSIVIRGDNSQQEDLVIQLAGKGVDVLAAEDPAREFVSLDLRGVANRDISALFKDIPIGRTSFGGIPFTIPRVTQNYVSTQASVFPHFPESVTIPTNVAKARRVHILLNGGNTFERFRNQQVGELLLRFADGLEERVVLIVSENLRDNAVGVSGVIDVFQSRNVREVYRCSTPDERVTVVLDLLSFDISNTSNLLEVSVRDTSNETAGSQDPAFSIYGITVEKSLLAPSVTVHANPSSGSAPLSVQFSSQVSDPQNQQMTLNWSFGDGATSSGANASHTYSEPGTYTVVLTATNEAGEAASATTTVVVSERFLISPESPRLAPGETRVFRAAGGQEPFAWTATDGELASTQGRQVTYTAPPSTGRFEVAVFDANGLSATATVTVAAALRVTPGLATLRVGVTQQFTATNPAGAATWRATAGDLSATSGASVTYTPPQTGGVFSVIATDEAGRTAMATVHVIGTELRLTPELVELEPGDQAHFTALGGTGSYSWSAQRGDLNTTSGTLVTYTAPRIIGGFLLTVTDTAGNAAFATNTVVGDLRVTPASASLRPHEERTFAALGGSGDYTWTVQAGNLDAVTGARVVYTAPERAGLFSLFLNDSAGRQVAAVIRVVTNAVQISPAFTELSVGQQIEFLGVGGLLPYAWTADAGAITTTSNATVLYTAPNFPGTYDLVVHDSSGETGSARIDVGAPTGQLVLSPSDPTLLVGRTITFTVSGGSGSFRWTFEGDVALGSLQSTEGRTNLFIAGQGTGAATLVVIDRNNPGLTTGTRITVAAATPAEQIPVITTAGWGLSPLMYSSTAGGTITLQAQVADDAPTSELSVEFFLDVQGPFGNFVQQNFGELTVTDDDGIFEFKLDLPPGLPIGRLQVPGLTIRAIDRDGNKGTWPALNVSESQPAFLPSVQPLPLPDETLELPVILNAGFGRSPYQLTDSAGGILTIQAQVLGGTHPLRVAAILQGSGSEPDQELLELLDEDGDGTYTVIIPGIPAAALPAGEFSVPGFGIKATDSTGNVAYWPNIDIRE
ncbi:MAG: PKD domain-containing protein [Candidatus Tectomicrobia bacterium]|nr:PKD domain-containing protein [Candidatus Tectomicrobia bacterium]